MKRPSVNSAILSRLATTSSKGHCKRHEEARQEVKHEDPELEGAGGQ